MMQGTDGFPAERLQWRSSDRPPSGGGGSRQSPYRWRRALLAVGVTVLALLAAGPVTAGIGGVLGSGPSDRQPPPLGVDASSSGSSSFSDDGVSDDGFSGGDVWADDISALVESRVDRARERAEAAVERARERAEEARSAGDQGRPRRSSEVDVSTSVSNGSGSSSVSVSNSSRSVARSSGTAVSSGSSSSQVSSRSEVSNSAGGSCASEVVITTEIDGVVKTVRESSRTC